MKRNRILYILFTVITLAVGLASRKMPEYFGNFLAEYLGDTLWALLVFWCICILFNGMKTLKVALIALLFSYFIEVSQIYHAPWIDNIRNTTLGALVLGHGFLWTDIVCYTVGIFFGTVIDLFLQKKRN